MDRLPYRTLLAWALLLVLLLAALADVVTATDGVRGSPARADADSRVQMLEFFSPSLGRTMPYVVYLPPGYDDGPARYPVLFMLHGMGGSHRSWPDYGLPAAADRLIRAGEIAPLIVVMPEGETAYWVDHANGGPRWGSYVARDLVNEVDTRFRTLATRHARAIGGQSMGAHGALQLAMNHLDSFGVVGAHSIALRRHDAAPPYFGDRTAFDQRDPVSLCARFPEVARGFTLWLDIGAEDGWQPAATAFHQQLLAAGVTHSWTVWPGGHSGDYWSAHVEDYLRFYAAALTVGAAGGVSPDGPATFIPS